MSPLDVLAWAGALVVFAFAIALGIVIIGAALRVARRQR